MAALRKGGALTLVGNLAPHIDFPLQAVVTRQIRVTGSCASCGEYPQCIEMLASGAGIVVDHKNPRSLSAAIRRIITHPNIAEGMASEARRIAPSLSWDGVAQRYVDLARELLQCATWPVSA